MTHHLLGTAEIAGMLGVTRQRVHQLTQRPDWPAPEIEVSAGKIWRRDDVERWQRDHGNPQAIRDITR